MDLIGTRIGSYVVERALGSGGAGTVYACWNTLIDREVAVKVLHDEHIRDGDQVARFFQEAKAAADIGHPNIIVIIDYGTLSLPSGARTYVMMESLDGESLDKRLRRGGLSGADIAHVLRQIASALAACHGKGIIHRDLKPSNVFLCKRSFDPLFVKLLDFGTAKLTAPALDMHRTQYGMVIGTPAYMSPEQCDGRGAIDHRSDIYSLGVMLYELLTGTLPFDGELRSILHAHRTATPVPPRERNPNVPPAWEALCLRMMEKAREARFQSVTELALALGDLPRHAAAYEAARAGRAQTGHSGHTQVLAAESAGRATMLVAVDSAPAVPSGAYPAVPASAAYPIPASAAYPIPASAAYPIPASAAYPIPASAAYPIPASGAYPAVPASAAYPIPASAAYPATPAQLNNTAFDERSRFAMLVEDPRYAAFARTLMSRPAGRWFEVADVCRAAGVALPASLPFDISLVVAWLEHPFPDPAVAAVAFLSIRSGWSTVVLCGRPR